MRERALAALAILWPALLLWRLDASGLLSVDEPRYAAIGRAMAATGNWVTPTLWGAPWFEKPPLLFWLIGLATKLGLRDELAARVPIALVSAAFLLFFFQKLKRLFDGEFAFRATAILATSAGWFAYSQVAVTDIPLAVTFAGAMMMAAEWAVGDKQRKLPVAAGVLFGLAILAKAAVPVVLALPLVYWARARWPRLVVPVLLAIGVAAPWYWLCYRANGWPFVEELFVRHHLARFVSGETLHQRPFWFYLPVVAGGLFPWTPVVAGLPWRNLWTDRRLRFFLLWFGWGFLFLSLSSGKLPGYLLPLFPAAAVLLAAASERARTSLALVPALMLAVMPAAVAILPVAVDRGITRATHLWSPAALLGLGAAVAIGIVTARINGAGSRFAFAVASVVMVFAVTKPLLLRGLDESASARREAAVLKESLARLGNPIFCRGELRRTWEYQLQYYLGPIAACPEFTNDVRLESTSTGELVLRLLDQELARIKD